MELDKIKQERLSMCLAEPDLVDQQDIPLLKDLSRQFPYFEALHLLLAKAEPTNDKALATAALYTNGDLLHHVMQRKANLTDTNPDESNFSDTIEDAFVLESISSSDFFAFQENFTSEEITEEVKDEPVTTLSTTDREPVMPKEEPVSVSNYDDDTLPYTFLWWLAKTRKEHQAVFQPYATPKKRTPGELQQQYVEHIFHIQSPFNAEELINNTPKGKHIDHKETSIIDDFLKKAPQISPPKPEQIDNENKAKKSAEDHNDLVSETLAKIYIEQMLYHKAIDTYQKLSLKFPEKSRYFADLIQSLEKKI
ncbi:hypothetical protein [Pedobacter sp.]|uniref:hypothetical protein n=1 Tax=Pedobacter sp. TaxID=1411316 RepID=UPI003D7FD9FF